MENRSANVQSDVSDMMAEDEARFIDRSKSQLFIVEEQNSPPENLLGNKGA